MLNSARSEQKPLTKFAEQELRQTITRGAFRCGSQFQKDAALCQILGVSRTFVREALREMIKLAGLTSGTRHLAVQSETADDEPLICSREYHLPNAFDLIVWRRVPTRLQGVLAESTP
jgi:DNA-binding FadR family transcriptional regulator